MKHSINQSFIQSINQSINLTFSALSRNDRPECFAYLDPSLPCCFHEVWAIKVFKSFESSSMSWDLPTRLLFSVPSKFRHSAPMSTSRSPTTSPQQGHTKLPDSWSAISLASGWYGQVTPWAPWARWWDWECLQNNIQSSQSTNQPYTQSVSTWRIIQSINQSINQPVNDENP